MNGRCEFSLFSVLFGKDVKSNHPFSILISDWGMMYNYFYNQALSDIGLFFISLLCIRGDGVYFLKCRCVIRYLLINNQDKNTLPNM